MDRRLRNLVDSLREKGLLEGKVVVIPETDQSRQVHKDVTKYLENLRKFEAASRKVNIVVGGDGCSYCHPATIHNYPNYC